MSVKEQLTKVIEIQMEMLKDMKPGTEEYKNASDVLAKRLDKLNEMDRNDYDYWDKCETREKETELKLKQLAEDRRDHNVKNVLTGVSVVGGFALTVWGTLKSLNFEKDGTVTTLIGRGFINKLLHKN